MSNFTYLSVADNVIPDATVSLVGMNTADTDFPLTNLEKLPISLPYRTSGNVSESKVLVDLGAGTHSIDFAAVVAHNLSPEGSIQLRRGPTSNPSGRYEVDMEFSFYNHRLAFYFFSTSVADRYWSFTLAKGTGETDYKLGAGYLLMGSATELPMQFSSPYRVQRIMRQRYVETESGEPIVGEILYDRYGLQVSFENMDTDEAEATERFLRDLDWRRYPVLIAPEGPDSEEVYFARLQEPQSREFETSQEHVRNLRFLTDPFGREIT